jgi:hypothetical protein
MTHHNESSLIPPHQALGAIFSYRGDVLWHIR